MVRNHLDVARSIDSPQSEMTPTNSEVTETPPLVIQGQRTSTNGFDEGLSIGHLLDGIVGQLKRIADHFDPLPPPLVGSPYIADRLGCTTFWVTKMVRRGEIPVSCVVPGTGNGKPWKFFRSRVDDWLKTR